MVVPTINLLVVGEGALQAKGRFQFRSPILDLWDTEMRLVLFIAEARPSSLRFRLEYRSTVQQLFMASSRNPNARGGGVCSFLFLTWVSDELGQHTHLCPIHALSFQFGRDDNVHDVLSWIGAETMKMSPCLPPEIENETTILAIHHHDHHYGDTPVLREKRLLDAVPDTDGDQPHLTHLSTGADDNMAFLWGRTHRTAMASVPEWPPR